MNKKMLVGVSIFLFVVLASIGNYSIQQMHSGGFYRTSEEVKQLGDVVYYEEGLYATVTVRELAPRGYALFINGKPQGSFEIMDLRVNSLLAYLPSMIKPQTENALVIGLGTGTTSGQLAQVSKVTTVEIEPKVIEATNYFKSFNLNILENPSHDLIIDDGRNYLLKTKTKYDIIVQEPSDPWQSFSSSLYSKEFFELVKEDLEEDGLFVKWVPIYTMSPEDFKKFYRTFDSVFPNNIAFANIKSSEDTPVKFGTSEIILVGSKSEIGISEEKFIQGYNSLSENSKQYLANLRLSSGMEVYHLLLFTSEQMDGYADDAESVTDDRPILEFSTAKNVLNQKPRAVIEDINNFLGDIDG